MTARSWLSPRRKPASHATFAIAVGITPIAIAATRLFWARVTGLSKRRCVTAHITAAIPNPRPRNWPAGTFHLSLTDNRAPRIGRPSSASPTPQ